MVHVLVRHKVADYPRWKEVFDAHLNTRKRAGEMGCHLFHDMADPRNLVLLMDWQTVEEARKFIDSEDLRSTMQTAGVQGSPEVQYLEDALSVHRTAAD